MNEMRVVIVGKTGVGKSGVGNSLLKTKHFKSNTWAGSITSKCKYGSRKIEDGTNLVIVDTPGIFDTSKSNMDTSKEVVRCIGLSSPGPHVFFFVLRIGARFTAEERDTIQSLKDIFGTEVMRYVIVVFTGKDNLEEEEITLDEYLAHAPPDLNKLIAECNDRFVAINNRAKPDERERDIQEIFQVIRKTITENGGKHYTVEMYIAEMRVVIVGKTGVGKSSVGNSLLKKKQFMSNTWADSITSKCICGSRKLEDGTNLVIVDTPGIFDTSKSNIDTSKEVVRCIGLSSPGPHAFFFILKIGSRFTPEERDTIQWFKDIFGKEVMKYVIVVFTFKDNLEEDEITLDEYIDNTPPEINELIAECKGRFVAINNRARSDERERDIQEIFKVIQKTMTENGGKHYTGEMYEAAEKAFKEKLRLLEEEKYKKERELDQRAKDLEEKNLNKKKQLEEEMTARIAALEEKERQRDLETKKREEELSREIERLNNLRLEEEKEQRRREEKMKQLLEENEKERHKIKEERKREAKEREKERRRYEKEREDRRRSEEERESRLEKEREERKDREEMRQLLEEELTRRMKKIEEESLNMKKKLEEEMAALRAAIEEEQRQHDLQTKKREEELAWEMKHLKNLHLEEEKEYHRREEMMKKLLVEKEEEQQRDLLYNLRREEKVHCRRAEEMKQILAEKEEELRKIQEERKQKATERER